MKTSIFMVPPPKYFIVDTSRLRVDEIAVLCSLFRFKN